MAKAKLVKIGDNLCLIIPNETVERLNLSIGDELHILDTQKGIEITPYDPEFEEQMEVARAVMKSRNVALSKLAK